MGAAHSTPEDRLKRITKDVTSLRSSLRHSRQNLSRDKKEAFVESLAMQSTEVSSMHGKVKQKKIDESLKIISSTMEEILQIEPRDLDMGAVESDSFVHMPISNQKRASSLGSLMSQRTTTKTMQSQSENRNNANAPPTIREIEAKVDELKPKISTAIDNKDTRQLRVYKKTIEVLARDLEMILVETDTPLEQRKNGLMKKLTYLYQNISKALKDLKRDDNLQYLSNQSRKENALKDLADLELRSAENESLIDKMVKERNVTNGPKIHTNVEQITRKLAKVEIVDTEIKDKVVILSQKLTEMVNILNRTMARKEFDSKFAKLLETFERVIRNFNKDINAEATMNTLEHLHSSVENLEEVNDTTKNRKRELLSSINKQIEKITEELTKKTDEETIQQIVEDNVVLRKKVKSTDKEHTVIDQFINYWNNVKSNFNINAYSDLSLLRIDSILEEMQQSIHDIRLNIAQKCDTNPPTNLTRKHSQSVPKLNTKRSYGSHHSLDQLDSKIIKAKAKMYQLSTPELVNVQNQGQSHVNNRFSKIEEIKMQVHYIKEKIDESHNKNLLREKLETYLENLVQFYKDSNKTVANNAIIVSNDINELIHLLVVTEYKEKADKLIKRVQNFNGTRYDKEFDNVKDELIRVQVAMENFNIPEQYERLRREKDQLLDEIVYNLQSLLQKTTFYRRPENENSKKIKVNLQTLSDKVKRFSGTYKGVVYNQIERELTKTLLLIGEQMEDKVSADEATKQVERLLKILEQRSSLAQSFKASNPETTKTEGQMGMTKIKNDLINIKKEIDKTPEENVDAFIGLQSRLDLVIFELSQIGARSNENLEKEKDIFNNEAQTLKNVVDAKVALGQQPLVQWPEREMQPDLKEYPKNDVNKEMEKLENKFELIKQAVSAPTTGEDIHKYYKLAQDIRKLLGKLDEYKLIKGTDLHMRKISLLNEMQYYLDALEKEAKDADYVISIEKKVDTLESIINSNQTSDIKAMAQELQAIQSKLDNHNVNAANQVLNGRKTSVQQKTDDLALKIKQMADSEMEKRIEETKKVSDIEEKVKALRPEVLNFVGVQSDSKFYELDETTMRLILVLDKLELNSAELQKRKIKLLKELHSFGQVLDDKAQQTEVIVDLEKHVEGISSLIQTFSGKQEELTQLKQILEKTANKAQSIRIGKDMVSRKNACMEKLSVLFNRVMTLSVSPSSPPLEVQEYQDSNHTTTVQSSGYSSMSNSSRTLVTEHSSSGYTTQLFNFLGINNGNSVHSTNQVGRLTDSRLAQIEKEFNHLEFLMDSANDSGTLEVIDDALTECTMQLNSLTFPTESADYKKKMGLFEAIENLTEIIEKKLGGNQNVSQIELEVDEIGHKMDTSLSDKEIDQLDERLIQLQIVLGKMKDPALKTQIDACMMKIILYAKTISDYKQSLKNTAV